MNSAKKPMQWPPPEEERLEDDWQLYPEAFQAWRSWRVIELDGVILLQSITYKTNWIPRQEMIAKCLPSKAGKEPSIPHPAPDPQHGCGIVSVKNEDSASVWRNYLMSTECGVIGKVSIWGHVFEFQRGYLSEFAYPSMLIISSDFMGTLGSILSHEELAITLRDTYCIDTVTE